MVFFIRYWLTFKLPMVWNEKDTNDKMIIIYRIKLMEGLAAARNESNFATNSLISGFYCSWYSQLVAHHSIQFHIGCINWKPNFDTKRHYLKMRCTKSLIYMPFERSILYLSMTFKIVSFDKVHHIIFQSGKWS